MKIVSGRDALISIALGFSVYTCPKFQSPEERTWRKISTDHAHLRLFLDEESNRMFEYGVELEKE